MDLESPACSPRPGRWRLRDASPRRLLRQVEWGSLLSTVAICVALLIAQAILGGPRQRPFLTTDATISYPHYDSSIPYWVAVLVSLAAALGSVLLCELCLAHHSDATDALAAVVHFVVDALSAFFVTGLATSVSKTIVGRLRPNFLALCQPAVPNPLTVAIGAPPSANPACSNTADPGELEDAHYSFPSGHTSTVFVFSLWTATYCLWALNLRPPRQSTSSLAKMGLRARVMHELGSSLGLTWLFALVAWAWAVGISRITDFKHHPSDVVAGALMGAIFGVLYAARAIMRLDRVVVGAGACGGGAGSEGAPEASLLHDGRVCHQAPSDGASV